MDIIILIILLIASVLYNFKQYKQINTTAKPSKKSAYKKSWENGGKAKSKW